jgi:transcriptional regulator with XRE-family HTH domain
VLSLAAIDLGGKIRKLRLQIGLSVKDVAELTNVTSSLISQIERNTANPSLATLKKIADVLNVPLSFLFSEENNKSLVVKKNNRRKIILGEKSDITQELLSPDLNSQLEFLYISLEKGASSEGYVSHKGEECGLVLEGTLELTLGIDTYVLEEGDSITFDSNIPHSLKNIGDDKLNLIWVITPPTW